MTVKLTPVLVVANELLVLRVIQDMTGVGFHLFIIAASSEGKDTEDPRGNNGLFTHEGKTHIGK